MNFTTTNNKAGETVIIAATSIDNLTQSELFTLVDYVGTAAQVTTGTTTEDMTIGKSTLNVEIDGQWYFAYRIGGNAAPAQAGGNAAERAATAAAASHGFRGQVWDD